MAIKEYFVRRDMFQVKSMPLSGPDFPCSACKFVIEKWDIYPCNICGHNINAIPAFECVLCDTVQSGDQNEGLFLAKGTPACIGPICGTCMNTIKEDIKS